MTVVKQQKTATTKEIVLAGVVNTLIALAQRDIRENPDGHLARECASFTKKIGDDLERRDDIAAAREALDGERRRRLDKFVEDLDRKLARGKLVRDMVQRLTGAEPVTLDMLKKMFVDSDAFKTKIETLDPAQIAKLNVALEKMGKQPIAP